MCEQFFFLLFSSPPPPSLILLVIDGRRRRGYCTPSTTTETVYVVSAIFFWIKCKNNVNRDWIGTHVMATHMRRTAATRKCIRIPSTGRARDTRHIWTTPQNKYTSIKQTIDRFYYLFYQLIKMSPVFVHIVETRVIPLFRVLFK